MTVPRESTKIVVVGGGGTIGSSTALHLIRSGYKPANITVLDVYPIPSSQSAGHDLNKIMSIRISNKPDLQLSLEALDMWENDPLFRPFFHSVGMLEVNCSSSDKGIQGLRRARQNLINAKSDLEKTNVWLDNEDEILAKMPAFTREQVNGWKGVHSQNGGWLAAAKAINAIGDFLRDQGVKFGFGRHAWVFAHIQLTPEEAAEFKNTPVIYDGEYGFFFEPTEDNIIKVCDEFPGFTRFLSHKPFGSDVAKQISVPRSHSQHPTDTYPDASEGSIRKAVARFLPRFKDRQLLNRSMCWCTDTADANLLICEHPRWKNFILATGDSGHSFKFLPNVGKHVVELIEGTLSEDLAYSWRWRPGGDALKSGRAAHAKDLADMPGWNHDQASKL
ncbi:hypothetical protein LRP88_06594 [Fusarium phalaenopsidis]